MGTAVIASAVISGKRAHGKEPVPVFRKAQISGSDLAALSLSSASPGSTATCTWQKEQLSSSSEASNKSKKEPFAAVDDEDDGRWQTVTVTTTGARSSPAGVVACRISESSSKSEDVDPVGSFPVEEEAAVEDGTMLGRRVFCSAARMVWPHASMRFPAVPDKISTSMLMVKE